MRNLAVDKNLFLYDLAVVAIMKNEGLYVKEWLDYHLLAGVNHFYIYDNESTDNMKEVLQPYVDARIVTYTFAPEKHQSEVYNEAKRDFRFFCRYIAFIDGDEFIIPKLKPTIQEVADDILSSNQNAAALAVNWRMFGSNFQETADYSKGVLERFTRCTTIPDQHVKTIFNPRKIKFFYNPHFAVHFDGCYAVNENKNFIYGHLNKTPSDNKIVIHHYHMKSKEEYAIKMARGNPDNTSKPDASSFNHDFANDIFNDEILTYRESRLKNGGGR